MSVPWQIRRGLTSQILNKVYELGEPVFDIALLQFRVGDGQNNGGKLIGPALLFATAIQNTPPGSPANFDTYICGDAPTGAWTGKAKNLAVYAFGQWNFLPPISGQMIFLTSIDRLYIYDGTAWVDYLYSIVKRETIAISSTGITTLSRIVGVTIKTHRIELAAGTGSYDATIRLSALNCVDGMIARLPVKFPASSNPTIQILDDSSGDELSSETGVGTAFSRYYEFSFNGGLGKWQLDQD